MTRREYEKYLQSSHWQKVRERRLIAAGHRCEFHPITGGESDMKHGPYYGERCERTVSLQVHHLHYESVGSEKDEDLEVLCQFHHLVRESIGSLDCPICGDGPMDYDEEDIIREVKEEIAQAGGINLVTIENLRQRCSWVISCTYCSR